MGMVVNLINWLFSFALIYWLVVIGVVFDLWFTWEFAFVVCLIFVYLTKLLVGVYLCVDCWCLVCFVSVVWVGCVGFLLVLMGLVTFELVLIAFCWFWLVFCFLLVWGLIDR